MREGVHHHDVRARSDAHPCSNGSAPSVLAERSSSVRRGQRSVASRRRLRGALSTRSAPKREMPSSEASALSARLSSRRTLSRTAARPTPTEAIWKRGVLRSIAIGYDERSD